MVVFVGIDVQIRRDCPFAVLDETGAMIEAGWLPSTGRREAAGSAPERLAELIERLRKVDDVTVGIDAPRTPLPAPRSVGFRGRRWGPLKGRGLGRHCEVVIRSLKLANPQWTPLAADAPEWMRLGFRLFDAAAPLASVFEVFPTATYRALAGHEGNQRLAASIDLNTFAPGPKDMLDAVAGAATVRALVEGKGCEVGGGDGLGTIVLPRPLTPGERASPVHDWPAG